MLTLLTLQDRYLRRTAPCRIRTVQYSVVMCRI